MIDKASPKAEAWKEVGMVAAVFAFLVVGLLYFFYLLAPGPAPVVVKWQPLNWYDEHDVAKVVDRLSQQIAHHERVRKGGNALAIKEDKADLIRRLEDAQGKTVQWSLPISRITTTSIELKQEITHQANDYRFALSDTKERSYRQITFVLDKDVPKSEFLRYKEGDRFAFVAEVDAIGCSSNLFLGYSVTISLVNVKHQPPSDS